MRIAWVHSTPPAEGHRGALVRRLAPVLRRRGHALRVLHTGPLHSPAQIERAVRRLSAEVKSADIVHAQDGSGCAFVASRLPGRKVLSIRGSDWYGLPSRHPRRWLDSWVGRRLTRASLRRYDLMLSVSERMRGDILSHHPSLRVQVLPGGIDLDAFRPMASWEARTRLGETDRAPWVLFAQPSRPRKRFALALAAVSLVRREIPDLRLVCLEGRPLREVPLWINACDAVLLTSTHEGWPSIIKEGLACGVPFTSTDVSDLQRIAEVEPSCRVTDPTPESLARGLLSSLGHGRSERLRLHARPFDLEAIAEKLIGCYRDLLPPPTARTLPLPAASGSPRPPAGDRAPGCR
jgi:teichuronic acid biosynthesis glycosyltransferase TuaC